jgi:Smg protein
MFDILFYLVENFFPHGTLPDNETITRKLSDAGFEEEDISEVLGWLRGFGSLEDPNAYRGNLENSNGFRVFSPEEVNGLSTKARGFLTFLVDSELISSTQRETIIERVIALSESQVGVDEIKLIVLLALWHQQESIDGMMLELLAARDESSLQ